MVISVRVPESGVWYVCDVMYAVLYVRVSCFVVFSVVNVYLNHLKLCVVCIDS